MPDISQDTVASETHSRPVNPVFYAIHRNGWLHDYRVYSQAESAEMAAVVASLETVYGRPITTVAISWKQREEYRLMSGFYTATVWQNGSLGDDIPETRYHFLHLSRENPLLVAFTESDAKGEADRQTSMKPGRYLAKYYGRITEKRRAALAAWLLSGTEPGVELSAVQFAATPDDIAQVYQDGPKSCMDNVHFSSAAINPTRIYGAGDLQIAYASIDGRIVARALVWPKNNIVGRVYPTPDRWTCDGFTSYAQSEAIGDALLLQLRALGYSPESESDKSFDGAQLLAIGEGCGEYVMPYLDRGYGVDYSVGDSHFIMACDGAFSGNTTSGTIRIDEEEEEDDDRSTCDRCNDRMEDGDETTVRTGRRQYATETWCHDCASNNGFYCNGYDQFVDEELSNCVEVEGESVSELYIGNNPDDYFECEQSGNTYNNDGSAVSVIAEHCEETWSADAFANYGFTCQHDGNNYADSEDSLEYPGVAERNVADFEAAENEATNAANQTNLDLEAA